MSDTQRIYQKLIEVSETVAGIKSAYEEGKLHAIESWSRNNEAHDMIQEKLDQKVEFKDVSTWVWIQKNPRLLFIVMLIGAGGIAAIGSGGLTKIVKILLGGS